MSSPIQPNSANPFPTPATSQVASEWILRRDRGLTAAEVEELSRWLSASTANAEEYERLNRCWQHLDSLRSSATLRRAADDVEITALRRARKRRRNRWLVPFAAAAAIVIAAMVLPHTGQKPALQPAASAQIVTTPESYVVRASSARRMDLPDGSVAELNGESRIEVNYSDTERRVALVQGEALFTVVKNPYRPFYVTAGAVSVRAVGTAFNVMMTGKTIQVLVTEGSVKLAEQTEPAASATVPALAPRALNAGECALVRADADKTAIVVNSLSANEIEQVLAWKSTQLIFDRTPLDQVVNAFNRYNEDPVVLRDEALKSRTITGVFRADNREGFIRLLRASVDIVAEKGENGQTILRAAP